MSSEGEWKTGDETQEQDQQCATLTAACTKKQQLSRWEKAEVRCKNSYNGRKSREQGKQSTTEHDELGGRLME